MKRWANRAVHALRDADWLTGERARAHLPLIAVTIAIQGINLVTRLLLSMHGDPHGRPSMTDFDPYWSGAVLALQGHPALAYDPAAITAAETIGAQPIQGHYLPYLYPPLFMLLSLPLALLPYLAALAAFMAVGGTGFIAVLRRILPPAWPTLAILAFPPVMMNATMGQNGFFSALCFAGAMLLLDRRPAWGGICFGLLAFKPHLAICIPIALLAARRWTPLATCAATAAVLALLSWIVLGSAPWMAFLASSKLALPIVYGDLQPKMLSTFAAIRVLHGGAGLADAGQVVATCLALFCVARVAIRRPGAGPEVATIVAAGLLCTPYVYDYDLACLAIPMAWLAGCGAAGGWRGWEKLVLSVAYLFPLEARVFNEDLGLPLTPLLLAALLGVVVSRSRMAGSAAPQSASCPAALIASRQSA